jgi:hypothetical protein
LVACATETRNRSRFRRRARGSTALVRSKTRALRLLALSALLAGGLASAPGAEGRAAANPALHVNFFTNGSITVTTDSGAPLGTSSGAPTVIPAGYYTILLVGPGGCSNVPYFELHGPGANIVDNMDGGELSLNSYPTYFAPNSTYTWRDDDTSPPLTFTFATSGEILGTAPAVAGPTGIAAGKHGTAKSVNPFAPAATPIRGKLTGTVSASGKLTLVLNGKPVTSLGAGTYTITVTDHSTTSGFLLEKASHVVDVTGAAFVGTRTTTVKLIAGMWFLSSGLGTRTYSIAVA